MATLTEPLDFSTLTADEVRARLEALDKQQSVLRAVLRTLDLRERRDRRRKEHRQAQPV